MGRVFNLNFFFSLVLSDFVVRFISKVVDYRFMLVKFFVFIFRIWLEFGK